MPIREISYYEVTCDYPHHSGPRNVGKGYEFHRIGLQRIICRICWNDVMTVEELLDFLGIDHKKMCPEEITGL